MSDDLQALEDWAGALLAKLQPTERRKLTRSIATELRRSQQQRISAQRNPDGTAYEPRKPQNNLRGKVGRVGRKMFTNLKTTRHLKTQSDARMAGVTFTHRVDKIARIHHYGERGLVKKDGPKIQYPKRQLLGFTKLDSDLITSLVLENLQ